MTTRPARTSRSQVGVTLRALSAGWRAEVSGAAEYRVDLITGTVIATVWLAISVTPVLVLASHTDGAGGWTLPRLLLVQAVWYLVDGVVWLVLIPNVGFWDEYVRQGTLDGMLLRPVNSLVMCSLSRLHLPDAPKLVLAVGLGVTAIALGGGPVGLLPTVGFVLATASAMVLIWAVAVLCNYKVLTQVQFDGWSALFAAHNLSRIPIPLYGPLFTVILTAVVPVAFFATVPAQVFFGDVGPWVALVSVALAAGAIALAGTVWRRELLRYSGAMG